MQHFLIRNACAFCQERSNEGRWWPRVDQKDSPKSKHIDSTCLKPTSSICPPWSKQKISKRASMGLCYLSNACCHPKGLGVSKMLRKPSRCDTPLTPSRALLEWQLEARQDAFRHWNVTRCPCFAKCIQFQMSLIGDTIACYWYRLRLGINTVIHITTVPFFFLVSLGKYS